VSRVNRAATSPEESAAQKEKAGESSRSPNTVVYKNKYSTNYRIVKGNFQEILGAWAACAALAVDSGEAEWSANSSASTSSWSPLVPNPVRFAFERCPISDRFLRPSFG
jgi:hypothetical protein